MEEVGDDRGGYVFYTFNEDLIETRLKVKFFKKTPENPEPPFVVEGSPIILVNK